MYDIVIIGAGITGTVLARELARYDLKIALIDKENDIACGATMANSAIVHTGYDPEDGTMMAKLNPEGCRLYEQLCNETGCCYRVTGAFIAACGEEEEKHLDILAERADKRGIEYRFLDGNAARGIEPALSDDVTKVLDFYTTAVIYPWEVAIACAEVAVRNGMELYLNSPCTGIGRTEGGYIVHTPGKDLECKLVVNAAGVYAEEIAKMVSEQVRFHITPRRGEYYVLDDTAQPVQHIIFPVPSKEKGKGVLAVPTVHGNTLLGPSSDVIDSLDDNGTSTEGLGYVKKNIYKLLKDPMLYRSMRTFAGLRPSSNVRDFVIEEAPDAEGFINASCIESPGIASAPAIAKYIVSELISKRLELNEKPGADLTRKPPIVMRTLTPEQRTELIKKDPAYGRMICRCCQVSEGEIVACIHSICGARTVKGVKKRTGPGFGRCQGGFCEPLVVGILARELGCDPTEIVLDSAKSKILESENR